VKKEFVHQVISSQQNSLRQIAADYSAGAPPDRLNRGFR
jgi:hypothetical protein